MGSAAQLHGRLAENATGKKVSIPKGITFVDEKKIQVTFQAQMLETIVEDECIAAELSDGPLARKDTVTAHEDGNAGKICGQHERLIPRLCGIQ
jgi:hypothetical protein